MFKLTTSILDSTALSKKLSANEGNGNVNCDDDNDDGGGDSIVNNCNVDRTRNNNENIAMKRIDLGINTADIHLQPMIFSRIAPIKDVDIDEDLAIVERVKEEELYNYNNLNDEQRIVYDYVVANPKHIITIQAGPGCGKSFLLKTIAYNIRDIDKQVIIFKHDLLHSFRHCAQRHTVAKFIMQTLNISYFEYKALDRQISSNITSVEFMISIIGLIRKAQLKNIGYSLIFLDEYTIISKPILLILLMILEHHQIGTIVCGDKNQLQNIHNSQHAILSSHTLASSFSRREFNLHINERCKDSTYNDFVNYFADFSSNHKIDTYAYAIISAVFMKQLVQLPDYNCIHLASTHQELTNLAHTMVCNNKYDTDFYLIDQSRIHSTPNAVLQHTLATVEYLASATKNNSVPIPGKFLPYLPLVVGARYYIEKHSEYSQGVLLEYRRDDGIIKMQFDNGVVREYGRTNANAVIFEEHVDYLMRSNDDCEEMRGAIYGFPIYPANFMSIHKCQGCTIRGDLDLMLTKTNYQGLYVALSRVTTPKQIRRVTIPNQVSHLASTIVNFPEHCHADRPITIEMIKQRMINYKFYRVDNSMVHTISELCLDFVLETNFEARFRMRQRLIDHLDGGRIHLAILKTSTIDEPCDYNLITMSRIIKYRDVFRALSCLEVYDYNVWLHEFILASRDMSLYTCNNTTLAPNKNPMIVSSCKGSLAKIADWDLCYPMDVATTDYIRHFAKTNVHIEASEQQNSLTKYCIENPSELVFLESTEFCCRVYHKYKRNETITVQWLVDELNVMLAKIRDSRHLNRHPQKSKGTKATKIEFIKRPTTNYAAVSKVPKLT